MTCMTNDLFEYILVRHRWLFVVPFLLPMTVLYELYHWSRNWFVTKFVSAPWLHEGRVRDVQRQVRQWRREHNVDDHRANDGGDRRAAAIKKMCTARPGWQTMSFRRGLYKNSMFNVKIDMHDILRVDVEDKFVRLEPMVTMGQLSRTLNPLGWTLPVMPELDDLTIGGLIMGTGIESSSHKYGLMEDVCRAFELVTSDGSVVRCSKDENRELFDAVPWSHGTLGFLVAAEINIVPARKCVKLLYEPMLRCSVRQMRERLEKASLDPANEFVEMIAFSIDRAVLMTGTMVDEGEPTNAIGRWYKPWFFDHVESKLWLDSSSNEGKIEYIPLRDYYHRHSRSLFWQIREIVPFGNHPIFRFLLGWTMPPKVSLLKLTQTKTIKRLYEKHQFIQDLLLPMSKLEDILQMLDKSVKVYPLWLCPFKLKSKQGFVHSFGANDEMYVDVGVYGTATADDYDPVKTTRKIEKFLVDVGGYQMLYADTYTTREEFRRMFDHTLYDKVREDFDCEKAFPEVYDKVNKNARS